MIVVERSNARDVFARSNNGIMGSNVIRGMDVCLSLCVCCPVRWSDLRWKEYYCLKE
jgi:hypothetical protein